MNLYVYMSNNPLRGVDLLGLGDDDARRVAAAAGILAATNIKTAVGAMSLAGLGAGAVTRQAGLSLYVSRNPAISTREARAMQDALQVYIRGGRTMRAAQLGGETGHFVLEAAPKGMDLGYLKIIEEYKFTFTEGGIRRGTIRRAVKQTLGYAEKTDGPSYLVVKIFNPVTGEKVVVSPWVMDC